MKAQVDHLVVVAASLAQGVTWCEETLGITPGPGGEHPLMGTHNRLFSIASPACPRAYFEIIALQPGVTPTRAAGLQRWFDMDDPMLQSRVASAGPQLVHFVASVGGVVSAVKALTVLGLDRGRVVAASRQTASGLLSWRITVRDDGQRLFNGTLPTVIEWGAVHPTHNMAASGVTLEALEVCHPQAHLLRAAYQAIDLAGVGIRQGPANLVATLQTPKGVVQLNSQGV